ncbi:MAG: FG-GAP repeat domain-containing protein [Planctomycetota bacterium]
MSPRRLSALLLLVSASAPPLGAQSLAPARLGREFGPFQGAKLGIDMAFLGDLDGDGYPEWMAGRAGKQPGMNHPELRVFSGGDGSLLYDVGGFGGINSLFLESLADIGDVDGDGVDDFAFGNSNAPVNGQSNVGKVAVYSGKTGLNLYTVEGLFFFGGFGSSLAAVGDVNGDGRPDFVVGQLGTLNENAYMINGADGTFLFNVRGPTNLGDIEFGYSAAPAGDLDGDGIPDFAVGTHSGKLVQFFSGGTGALLRTVNGGPTFGRELADLGDADGDGLRDLLVNQTSANTVHLISGMDGSTLASVAATDGVDFGISIAGAGDMDGDGAPDFLVGDDGALQGAGRVRLYSSATLEILFELTGTKSNDHVGSSVAGGTDLNRDGWPDFLIGAVGRDGALLNVGEAAAWSGHPLRRRPGAGIR